jgi:hypothetical protein
MKKLLPVFLSILFTYVSIGQTIVFHEDFESPSYADSLVADNGWTVEDSVFVGQHHYARCRTVPSTSSFLTLQFTPIPGDLCYLYFNQICKIDFLDRGTLEFYSASIGSWQEITGLNYASGGLFGANGNRFSSNSYGPLWQPLNAAALPSIAWWKQEVFNLTTLFSQSDTLVKIRFREADGGPMGGGINYGWLIDNIRIVQSQNIVGIDDISKTALNVYPNPSPGILSLSYKVDDLKILSLSGQTLLELQQVDMVDLSGLAPGIYILDQCNGMRLKIMLY